MKCPSCFHPIPAGANFCGYCGSAAGLVLSCPICGRAGLPEEAIGYLQQAGQQAIACSAHVEAISHLNRGLGLLVRVPATSQRTKLELGLQMALGRALVATNGYSSKPVLETFARAHEPQSIVGEKGQEKRCP